MAWGVPIWFDLWLAGMAGGAYFIAFIVERFSGTGNRQLLRLATYVGIPMAIIGVLLLVIDLGSPLRFWHLFTEFKLMSPMSMGTWILMAWVGIAVVLVILWRIEQSLNKESARGLRSLTGFLSSINVVFAVLLMTYTGVLLAVTNQPLWAGTVLLPSLFIVSAISTGVAIVIITAIIFNAISRGREGLAKLKMAIDWIVGPTNWAISTGITGSLAKALTVIIPIELVVLIGYIIWLGTSSMVGAGEALMTLISGGVAIPFWVGVIVLAMLIPFGLLVTNWRKAIETKTVQNTIIVASTCVILGGLFLRAVIAVGGQL